MILSLLLIGVVLAALPGLRSDPPGTLPMQEWVPVATAAVIAGLAIVEAALVLIALPTVAHALGASHIADACHQVLAPFSAAPAAVGWGGAILALALATRFGLAVARARRRARDARAEPWFGDHQRLGMFDLVVVPTPAPLAFGAPGAPPQVVVSAGLLESMPGDAVDAIVRHEVAHHQLRHATYLALLAGVEGIAAVVRPARRSVTVIRHGMEIWADHVAGPDFDSRRSLRRALASLGHRDSGAHARARRLLTRIRVRPPAWRALSYAPVALMIGAAGLLTIGWLVGGHRVFTLAADCV